MVETKKDGTEGQSLYLDGVRLAENPTYTNGLGFTGTWWFCGAALVSWVGERDFGIYTASLRRTFSESYYDRCEIRT